VRGMVQFNPSHIVTIITIMNYDIYQIGTIPSSQPALEPIAGQGAAPIAEPRADPIAAPIRSGRRETGVPSDRTDEVPTEGDVRAEAESYPGNRGKGIPPRMPEEWWSRWLLSAMSRRTGFNWKFWRVIMKQPVAPWSDVPRCAASPLSHGWFVAS
jgi:hypothetical protein